MRFISILFLTLLALTACSSPPPPTSSEELPPGNASRGEALFSQAINGAPPCSTCHTINGDRLVGPSLQGYSDAAPTRVAGVSAGDYTLTSIVQPAAYLVSGFGNIMYNQYTQKLTSQQIADLIAYLLTL
jgi:mono/diheme cytochrome c family protein